MDEEILELLRAKLDLSDRANIDGGQTITDLKLPLITDQIIEDEDKIFFVEIVSKVTIDTIAGLVLLKDILQQKQREKKFASKPFFVIAGKVIPPREEALAKEVDITLVRLPHSIKLSTSEYSQKKRIKITSDKSWKVITRLLKEKATSIRQLALLEDVSYGWAHATIQSLISQGIVTKKGNYVSIFDVNKLLNGVAWERPFENLRAGEITIDYNSAILAAKEISHALKNQNIKFAFTSYTSGGLYTGYAVRHDAIYLYLEKKGIDFIKEAFGTGVTKGIAVRVYAPDRDVFSDKREIESIIVTSPAQTLLDLAGLGYSGLDIAKVMVDGYARI
ncbi:MAG: hypothetical protein U9O85_09795 [Euryarchaeota archaeon]|nr:hypothetical protein [Euryarchaeota archaeon]